MKKDFNKLVRDRIPEIIIGQGNIPETKILEHGEYIDKLVLKLKEEVDEFIADLSIEELADVMEVIISLKTALNIDDIVLENVRKEKAQKNGGFKNKIFLASIDYLHNLI